MVHGIYEDMGVMFSALGMHYPDRESADPAVRDGTDIDVFDGDHVTALLQDASDLARYSLVIVPCGTQWPGGSLAADNLRGWVKGGGKLYVDDFSYDFVEQVWRVLYTVYHTHSGGGDDDYVLLLQEKIMMYLILEIQTCFESPIVR